MNQGKKLTDSQLNEARKSFESKKTAAIQGAALNLAVMLNHGTGDIEATLEHYEVFKDLLRKEHDENTKGAR